MSELVGFLILYRDLDDNDGSSEVFLCQAENKDHAIEQFNSFLASNVEFYTIENIYIDLRAQTHP